MKTYVLGLQNMEISATFTLIHIIFFVPVPMCSQKRDNLAIFLALVFVCIFL